MLKSWYFWVCITENPYFFALVSCCYGHQCSNRSKSAHLKCVMKSIFLNQWVISLTLWHSVYILLKVFSILLAVFSILWVVFSIRLVVFSILSVVFSISLRVLSILLFCIFYSYSAVFYLLVVFSILLVVFSILLMVFSILIVVFSIFNSDVPNTLAVFIDSSSITAIYEESSSQHCVLGTLLLSQCISLAKASCHTAYL